MNTSNETIKLFTGTKKMKKGGRVQRSAIFVFVVVIIVTLLFPTNFLTISKINNAKTSLSISTRHHHIQAKNIEKWNSQSTIKNPPYADQHQTPKTRDEIICHRSHKFYDVCTIKGPTAMDPTTSTFSLIGPTTITQRGLQHQQQTIRPFPRKWENRTMSNIREFTIIAGPPSPPCDVKHNIPALVFSADGFTGNFFHDFNDVLIPLFITVNSIFHNNHDFVFVIDRASDRWVQKYQDFLGTLSNYPIIFLDKANVTHCFSNVTLGLISHGFMTINPKLLPNSKSFTHFQALLNQAYGSDHNHRAISYHPPAIQPRLVLVNRKGGAGREILNHDEVAKLAERIGFEVILFEPNATTLLHEAYALISTSHAFAGVHGAALTHALFLRPRSVFVQVVPLGTRWVAEVCFAKPARDIGLEYMEYSVGVDESSLVEKYGRESILVKDPAAYRGNHWSRYIMDIYLKEQNVQINLHRFKGFLEEAYVKAKRFMDEDG